MRERGISDVPVVIVSAQDAREEPLTSPLVTVSSGHGLSLATVLRYVVELLSLMRLPPAEAADAAAPR
jgi:hypothetical protein